jgi:hypothetical protein
LKVTLRGVRPVVEGYNDPAVKADIQQNLQKQVQELFTEQ